MRSLYQVFCLSLILGCQGKKEDATARTKPTETAAPGTLVVEEKSVTLNVAALSAAESFATANATQNAASGSPGSLAISTTSLTQGVPETGLNLLAAWPPFEPSSITSGAPDGFKMTITKLELVGKRDGQMINELILDIAVGVTISVAEGSTDLTALISALGSSASGKPEFKVGVGEYETVRLTLKRAADVKGCVSGEFNTGGNGVAGSDGLHTYCTKENLSTFSAVLPGPTEFEGGTAEWMKLDLTTDNFGKVLADDTFTTEFTIPGGLSLKKSDSESLVEAETHLTLVIDLNRMLRFYNQGRIDQGPNPKMPVNRAYFFNSLFAQSTYVFIGKPGRIYGYEFRASACPQQNWNAQTLQCTLSQGDSEKVVAAWLTIITDPQGRPIVHSIMPDDDNTLTVLKGSGRDVVKPYTAGATSALVNVHYGLSSQELGKLVNFPADLEDASLGSEMTSITFEAHMDPAKCSAPSTCDYKGPVYMRRKL